MLPETRSSLLFSASLADAVLFIGDGRARFYADRYVERPELFARPFFAVAYSIPDLSCANVFSARTLHPSVLYALENETLRAPLSSRVLSNHERCARAVTQGLLNVWQHGLNLTTDPILAFVVGRCDVLEIDASAATGPDLEEKTAERVSALGELLRLLVELKYTNVFLHGIANEPNYSDRRVAITQRLDCGFRDLAREIGVTYLRPEEPDAVIEQILADRFARRSLPLPPSGRLT